MERWGIWLIKSIRRNIIDFTNLSTKSIPECFGLLDWFYCILFIKVIRYGAEQTYKRMVLNANITMKETMMMKAHCKLVLGNLIEMIKPVSWAIHSSTTTIISANHHITSQMENIIMIKIAKLIGISK